MKWTLILLITIFTGTTASSQERQLTFEEAVTIGLRENVLMKNTRNNLKTFKADKSFNIASFTPNLGIRTGISQTSGPQLDPEAGPITVTSDNFNFGVGANLTLFSGNDRLHALKASNYRLVGQDLLVQRTEQDVINQVAVQFLQVLLDQELLKIAEENVVSQQRTLDEITGFVEAGSRPEVDRYRQEADVKSY